MAFSFTAFTGSKFLIDKEYFRQQVLDTIINMPRTSSIPPLHPDQVSSTAMNDRVVVGDSEVVVSNDQDSINSLEFGNEIVYYHPIQGMIFAYPKFQFDWDQLSWIRAFSTMRFVHELKFAESNPNVVAHFLHINSGGGEAWMMPIAAAAIHECRKPVYAFVECTCASAAYWLASQASVIKSFTASDLIGSIGMYAHGLDTSEWLKMNGIKEVEVYASRSDLKNKMMRDVLKGYPDQYITEILDPDMEQFIVDVRKRSKLSGLPDDSPVLRGEIFRAEKALDLGLIDGVLSDFSMAVQEAHDLGIQVRDSNQLLTNI